MKLSIITLSAIFCFFLYWFLDLYITRDTAYYISLATFIWLLVWMITPMKDTREFKDIEITEIGKDFEQEKRLLKTRIASEKRKERKSR